jgi:hypothetical protein
MRIRFFLAALSASAVSIATFVVACGGGTDEIAEGPDAGASEAGPDVVDAGAPDTGKETGAACDTTGDFTNDIPDAALGGVSTVGLCTQCLRSNCGTTIDTCNKDCNCRVFVSDVLKCVQKGKTVEQCALSSKVSPTANTIKIAQGLSPCLGKCNDPCAVDELADAGRDASFDAGQ